MTDRNENVKIIAEIGCNHKGDLSIAKELIQVAARVCKADVAKFQKRNNRSFFLPNNMMRRIP